MMRMPVKAIVLGIVAAMVAIGAFLGGRMSAVDDRNEFTGKVTLLSRSSDGAQVRLEDGSLVDGAIVSTGGPLSVGDRVSGFIVRDPTIIVVTD